MSIGANRDAGAAAPNRVAVEIAIDSVAGARAATVAGADRVELCSALQLGGLTPTPGLLRQVRRATTLPIVALLRPRAGDFLFTEDEFAVQRDDLEQLAAAGADAIAVGALTADGDLDLPRLRELAAAGAPLSLCCHRAFDLVRDPARALEQLIDLGCRRVLTSGQQRTAVAGGQRIAALVEQARGRIAVVAAAGIRAANVLELVRTTGVREVHLSASTLVASAMRHRNPAVAMGTVAPHGDDMMRTTDAAEIEALLAALRRR